MKILLILCLYLATTDASKSNLAEPINRFSLDYLDAARSANGSENVIFSPLSIANAFAMILAGAKGTTAFQIKQSLRLTNGFAADEDVHVAFKSLLEEYGRLDSRNTLSLKLASLVLLDNSFSVLENFVRTLQKDYKAVVTAEDFDRFGVAIMSAINEWVKGRTGGKIEKILQAPLDPETKMVLLNAVYFKGKWEHPFNTRSTFQFRFYNQNATDPKLVSTMNQKMRFNYTRSNSERLQMLELPYAGNVSFFVALPDERFGLNSMIDSMKRSPNLLDDLMAQLRMEEVDVYLPKFKVQAKADLAAVMPKLGLKSPFERFADLTGISSTSAPLYLSSAMHQAALDVDEEGSEGAAATALSVTLYSRPTNPVFIADHPFLFFIRDKITGVNLFMGTLYQL